MIGKDIERLEARVAMLEDVLVNVLDNKKNGQPGNTPTKKTDV